MGSDLGQGSKTFFRAHLLVLSRRNDKVLSLALSIDEGLGITGLWSDAASSIRGRSNLGFIHMGSRSTTLEKMFRLVSSYSDILDVVIEDGKLSLGVA